MRLKRIINPVKIVVDLGDSLYAVPVCLHDSYRPFPERSFEALAHGVWIFEGSGKPAFVAFTYGGNVLVASCAHLTEESRRALDACGGMADVCTLADMKDYGMEKLITEAHLLHNDFDVRIVSYFVADSAVHALTDFRWELNGHVKPVAGLKRTLVFDENKNFLML